MTDQYPQSTHTSAADADATTDGTAAPPTSAPVIEGNVFESPDEASPPAPSDAASELVPHPPPAAEDDDEMPSSSATATEMCVPAGVETPPDISATAGSDVLTSFDADYDDDKKPDEEFVSDPTDEFPPVNSSEGLAGKALSVPGPPESTKKDGVDEDIEKGKDGIVKKVSSTKKSKKGKPEMNPKFKDVHETGRWGELSRRELYIASAVFIVLLVVVLAIVGVMVAKNNNSDSANAGTVEYVPAPTLAPTMPPTNIPAGAELALVRRAISQSGVTSQLLQDLPIDATFYEGLMDDTTATPQQKAMSWLLYQDQLKDPTEAVYRWAFASIYYSMGGPGWTGSKGWLGNDPFCTWDYITCDRGNLQEIDLDGNNVTGTFALEFALLDKIQSIMMTRNQITGPIPGAVFAALPRLGLLYLDNNLLTGTIPASIIGNGGLHTLYLQANDLTGIWPPEFCNQATTTLREFGVDCDQVANCTCCDPLSCYYSS